MSAISEVGISPVLLQAIAQTLATRGLSAAGAGPTLTSKRTSVQITDSNGRLHANMNTLRNVDSSVNSTQKVVAHLLQDMNEPVSALLRQENLENDDLTEQLNEAGATGAQSEEIKELLRQRLGERSYQGKISGDESSQLEQQIIITDSDMSMVNVLTAIASHHLKSSGKTGSVQVLTSNGRKEEEEREEHVLNTQQYVVCYGDNLSVPSPAANDIVVSDAETGIPIETLSGRKFFINQNGEAQIGILPAKRSRMEEDSNLSEANDSLQSEPGTNGAVSVVVNADMLQRVEAEYRLQPSDPTLPVEMGIGAGCPICGDRVSGYHYGIFSCESCKGFFKRTVQNKKSFSCLRTGECEINVANRKKCPACRFQKCLLNGMKLEAIRSDRTRGGRSYYDGCSPHGKSKPSPTVGAASANLTGQVNDGYRIEPQLLFRNIQPDSTSPTSDLTVNSAGDQPITTTTVLGSAGVPNSPSSQLIAILNRPTQQEHCREDSPLIKPYVPQVLTDIMNLESILSDEDVSPQDIGQEKAGPGDDMYASLMQLTELRLYKLVRWARNLPQFSAIPTDDQILLLQHCWSDLLALGVCWRSMQTSNELRLAFAKSIDQETAVSMDIEDIFDRMMALTSQLRRLKLDNYEYVALKVLILISPDVKGLKDPNRIRDQQDKICDALHIYTASHYPNYPNKFGEMLLRLPELSRCSLVGKECLSSRQITGDLPSCSLLLELIRGENEVKDT